MEIKILLIGLGLAILLAIFGIVLNDNQNTERKSDRKGFNPNSYQGGHNKEENPPADTTNHQEKTTPDINYNGGHNA